MFIRVGKIYLNPQHIVSAAWTETFPEVGSYPSNPVLVFRVTTTAQQVYWPTPDLAGCATALVHDFTGAEAQALEWWLEANIVDVCDSRGPDDNDHPRWLSEDGDDEGGPSHVSFEHGDSMAAESRW